MERGRGRKPGTRVIFVDSNLFVIDLRYPDDANYRVNRRALDRLARDGDGMTSVLNVLELCGILSFNLSVAALHALYVHFAQRYRITVALGGYDVRLPAPTARDILTRMERRMALKDAEIAMAVEQHTASVSAFVSWNARHFAGKLPVPALTPRAWLSQRTGRRRR
jgi:hypothetical protein